MKANNLKFYLESNDLYKSLGNIEISEDIQEVKFNHELLAKYFIMYYSDLRNLIKNTCDEKVAEFINENGLIFVPLKKTLTKISSKLELGKTNARLYLSSYIDENYFKIIEFFDICIELYPKDDSLSEAIKELGENGKENE